MSNYLEKAVRRCRPHDRQVLAVRQRFFKLACRLRKVSPVFVLRLSYSLIFYMTRTAAIDCESAIATLSPRMIRGIKFLFADSVSVTAVRALG